MRYGCTRVAEGGIFASLKEQLDKRVKVDAHSHRWDIERELKRAGVPVSVDEYEMAIRFADSANEREMTRFFKDKAAQAWRWTQ